MYKFKGLRGTFALNEQGLRCRGKATFAGGVPGTCNQLLVRPTPSGQLSGEYKCPRCKSIIIVEMILPK